MKLLPLQSAEPDTIAASCVAERGMSLEMGSSKLWFQWIMKENVVWFPFHSEVVNNLQRWTFQTENDVLNLTLENMEKSAFQQAKLC